MTAGPTDIAVRAAGGLVIRGSAPTTAEIAIVHRPRYDDWSVPKGKVDPGESVAECALREIAEETGLRCHLLGGAGTTQYHVPAGRKQVDYFLMRPVRFSGFEPNTEVDEVRWVKVGEAGALLSHDQDRRLVAELDLEALLTRTDMHLIRHGAAGDRSRWDGPDEKRPLTPKGERQAESLAGELDSIGVGRVLSSPYVRCTQTVEPLAERIGVRVEPSDALAEGPDPRLINDLVDGWGGETAALCSHGDVIPAILQRLQRSGVQFHSPYECRKGSTWVISHDGERFTDARYFPPPTG